MQPETHTHVPEHRQTHTKIKFNSEDILTKKHRWYNGKFKGNLDYRKVTEKDIHERAIKLHNKTASSSLALTRAAYSNKGKLWIGQQSGNVSWLRFWLPFLSFLFYFLFFYFPIIQKTTGTSSKFGPKWSYRWHLPPEKMPKPYPNYGKRWPYMENPM